MGWTSYSATHFYDNGTINRKAECDAYFLDGLNRGYYKVVKSTIKGSIYYGAIVALKRPIKDDSGAYLLNANGSYIYEGIPENEQEVFGVVILTYVDHGRFGYKIISETSGPCYYDCPNSILTCLSPTTSQWAKEWREKCVKNNDLPKLNKLPIGAEIQFEYNGKTIKLRKCSPSYQFKTAFWFDDSTGCYFSKKRIPSEFTLIEEN